VTQQMDESTIDVLRQEALSFEPTADDVRPLVHLLADAPIVLLGEATHGTHEFYRTRAEITKALIERSGFNLFAVEADWPDAYRVNRWLRGATRTDRADFCTRRVLRRRHR